MKILISILFISFCSLILAQDIHWSLINSNPLFQNPGNTGLFNADHRFTFNIKDQWRKVTKPYTSTSIGYDTQYKYYPKINFGGILISDIAGDGSYKTLELKFLSAYELCKLESKNSFRIGLDFGFNYREMNLNAYSFDNQFDGYIYNKIYPSLENYVTNNTLNYTLSLGSVWSKKINSFDKMMLGVSFFNLNKPNQSLYNTNIQRDIRNTLFMQYQKRINSTFLLTPSINISKQGKYLEVLIGSTLNQSLQYNYTHKSSISINYGIYSRIKDALIFSLGTNFNNKYYALISYDINVSQLSKASNGRGSLEFSFIYLLKRREINKQNHLQCIDYL